MVYTPVGVLLGITTLPVLSIVGTLEPDGFVLISEISTSVVVLGVRVVPSTVSLSNILIVAEPVRVNTSGVRFN